MGWLRAIRAACLLQLPSLHVPRTYQKLACFDPKHLGL